MRVAVIAGTWPALSETFVTHHVTELLDRGLDVHLFARGQPPAQSALEADETIRRVRPQVTYLAGGPAAPGKRLLQGLVGLGTVVLRKPRGPVRLVRALKRHGLKQTLAYCRQLHVIEKQGPFDIVHAHFGVHGAYAAELKDLGLEGRLVVTFHGFDVWEKSAETYQREYANLFKHADACTANTNYTANRVRELGCPPDRLHLWPMGVDPDRFTFKERTRPQDGPIRLLTIGRLVPCKGTDVAIRALSKMRDHGQPIELHCVGPGSDERLAELKNIAAEWGVAERVFFHGGVAHNELPAFLDSAHIFVHPSRMDESGQREAQGVVLQEAHAAGLPIVASRSGGIPDSVIDGETAKLMPENDPDAIAEGLRDMLAIADQWPCIGHAGRRHVTENYAFFATTRALLNVYKTVESGNEI